MIDAIVYRKPVALKAVYYLIEKRLKLGLSFPETDFTDNENVLRPANTANLLTNTTHMPSSVNGGTSNGVVKHNSQLLPKRHGVPVARSGSQKNVDFKSIFNNMNINSTSNTNNSAAAAIPSRSCCLYRRRCTVTAAAATTAAGAISAAAVCC